MIFAKQTRGGDSGPERSILAKQFRAKMTTKSVNQAKSVNHMSALSPTSSIDSMNPIGAKRFPVPTDEFLVRAKKFPVPLHREFGCNTPESLRELTSGSAEMAKNLQNFLLFSLLSGEFAESRPILPLRIA